MALRSKGESNPAIQGLFILSTENRDALQKKNYVCYELHGKWVVMKGLNSLQKKKESFDYF